MVLWRTLHRACSTDPLPSSVSAQACCASGTPREVDKTWSDSHFKGKCFGHLGLCVSVVTNHSQDTNIGQYFRYQCLKESLRDALNGRVYEVLLGCSLLIVSLTQARTQTSQANGSTFMRLQPISMNVVFCPPILHSPYGRNAMRTKTAEKSKVASVMLTFRRPLNGSYGTGRASSSKSYTREMSPPGTCSTGSPARSLTAKHTSRSTGGISGGMGLRPWPLGQRRRLRWGSVKSVDW